MTTQEQRDQFELYKKDVERRGKSFFPYAMYHDTVMSLVVVTVIVLLSCVWYFTSSERPADAGILGPRYHEKADPGTTSFVPRPDWYFFFLFYLLRIFKWPESVFLGTVGIPTILLILLLAVPFMDRRRERRLARRPVAVTASLLVIASMGILTYKGATAEEALGSEVLAKADEIAQGQRLPEQARPGLEIFLQVGCLNCHTYAGEGSPNLGAPELTEEGTRNRGTQWQIDHLKNPPGLVPGSPMPAFTEFTDEQYQQLAVFLECSPGNAPACQQALGAARGGS
ncbi:MAG TPA: c-type cytochrome [Gaiellaceae bacterium]|nr:c-type cytochrome [Gaiellaceae bacterium]